MPPPGLQSNPAAAADGSLLYAVWTDGRLGPVGRLFWTRFTEAVSDTTAAPLTAGGAAELRPALGAGGGWALAVWEAWTDTGTRLGAAELPEAGPPAPRPWTQVTSGAGPVWRPAAAVHGEVGLLVWEDEREAPGDICFARWDRGTGLRDPGGLFLARGAEDQRWPRVAAGPEGFLVVWAQSEGLAGYRVLAQTVDAAGEPSGPPRLLSELEGFAPVPDVAPAADGYLVVWRGEGEGGGDLAGRFVDVWGVPLGTGPIPLVTGPGLEFCPRLAPAVEGWALAWLEQDAVGRALYRSWVSPAGVAEPGDGLVLGPPEDFCADLALTGWRDEAAALWRVPLPADDDDLLFATYAPQETGIVDAVPLTLLPAATGVAAAAPPARLSAYPNPFRARVHLSAPGSRTAETVEIFEVRGRRIRRLAAGPGGVVWDGRGETGEPVSPGVYFARAARGGAALRLVRIP